MSPFVLAEIASRTARIDPTLAAARAATRLCAIAHCLATAERDAAGALDLLLEAAAVCAAAAVSERYAGAIAGESGIGRKAICREPSPEVVAAAA